MIKTIVPVGLFALLLPLAACSGSARSSSASADNNPSLGTNASRLVGGASDTADPSVVLFDVTGDDGGDCTAEFISTTVLVTAAHCVLTEAGKPLPSTAAFRIYMGNDFSQVKDSDWINIDPKNVHSNPAYDGNSNDSAVLVLSQPQNVKPFAWSTQPLTQASVGQSARLIGYGANVQGTPAGDDGFGLKRQLTTTIVGFDADFVHIGKTGANGCGGDSGGPALVTVGGVETIIGLDSFSDQSIDCTGGDFYERIDTQAAFITPFLSQQPTPPAANDAGANNDDNNNTSSSSSGSPNNKPSTDDGDNETSDNTKKTTHAAPAQTSGCAMTPSQSQSPTPTSLAPWLGVLAVLGLRRRRDTRK